jgi:hypothetical protein
LRFGNLKYQREKDEKENGFEVSKGLSIHDV